MPAPSSGSADDAGTHATADAKSKGGDDGNSPQHDHGDEEGEMSAAHLQRAMKAA